MGTLDGIQTIDELRLEKSTAFLIRVGFQRAARGWRQLESDARIGAALPHDQESDRARGRA